MPSGSSHSHSTPSRMRTSTLSSVLCSPDCRVRLAAGLLVGLGVERLEPREHERGVVLRRLPQPALGGGRHVDGRGLPQAGRLVGDDLSPDQLGRRPGQDGSAREGTVGPAQDLPALVQGGGERTCGGVGQRHREGRVGLEGRRPHHRADDLAGRVADHDPPPLEGRVHLGPRVPAVRELAGGPLAHARDDAAQHGVGRQQLAGRVEEGLRGVEELQREVASMAAR